MFFQTETLVYIRFAGKGVIYAKKKKTARTGGKTAPARVCYARAIGDHTLWLWFSTDETKIFDFTPLLNDPAFEPLVNEDIFNDVHLDHGVPVWMDGSAHISPEYLYENGDRGVDNMRTYFSQEPVWENEERGSLRREREKAIQAIISTVQMFTADRSVAIERLIQVYHLTHEQAEKKVDLYWQ